MHQFVKLLIASLASGVVGWLLSAAGTALYQWLTGGPPAISSNFLLINWGVAAIVSGAVFIVVYIKIASWLDE